MDAYKDNTINETQENNATLEQVIERLDSIENRLKQSQEDQLTRESILAIKDTSMRLKAIEENAHLFKGMHLGGRVIE